ncbi:hypothetical protein ABZX92_39555, partial [Lentzea sp. NPDC006480]
MTAINEAEEQRAAASAELKGLPSPTALTDAEVQARLDGLDDVTTIIMEGKPERLARLYEDLGVELRYKIQEEAVYVTTWPAESVISFYSRNRFGPRTSISPIAPM